MSTHIKSRERPGGPKRVTNECYNVPRADRRTGEVSIYQMVEVCVMMASPILRRYTLCNHTYRRH